MSLFMLIIMFSGCGDKKFDGTETSLYSMIDGLSMNEQTQFILDFEFVANIHGGEKKLIGFSLKDINNEAVRIKEVIKNKNIDFLKEKILQMQNENQQSTYLDIKYGLISNPKMGYIYGDKYEINDLKIILELKGDVEDYKIKNQQKGDFFKGCLGTSNIENSVANNACECIWTSLITKYTNKELNSYSMNPTDEYMQFFKDNATNCLNKARNK